MKMKVKTKQDDDDGDGDNVEDDNDNEDNDKEDGDDDDGDDDDDNNDDADAAADDEMKVKKTVMMMMVMMMMMDFTAARVVHCVASSTPTRHTKRLHTGTFTQRPFYTDKLFAHTDTHTHAHTCSELSYRIVKWNASVVQNTLELYWQEEAYRGDRRNQHCKNRKLLSQIKSVAVPSPFNSP